MIHFYNPITGEWETVRDDRGLPVIARDTRLIIYNPDTIVVSATTPSPANVDPLGTSGTNAPPTIALPDAWRIRRIIITALRQCTDTLQATLEAWLYGRLVDANGDPVYAWAYSPNITVSANEGSSFGGTRFTRLVLPSALSGVLGCDQYRITFRLVNPSGSGEFRLSHIKVYVEV